MVMERVDALFHRIDGVVVVLVVSLGYLAVMDLICILDHCEMILVVFFVSLFTHPRCRTRCSWCCSRAALEPMGGCFEISGLSGSLPS